MTRSEGRSLAFELLYSFEIQKIEKKEQEEQLNMFFTQNEVSEKKVKKYIRQTIQQISENNEAIIECISRNLKDGWDLSRISKINLALLKLGIYEIFYAKLPYKIVVNEIVELAKKYGDDISPSFVNGILANVIKQNKLEEE